jgi:hypothetical protein
MMRIYLSERGGNVQLSDVPSLAPLHHAHDRHKSLVTGVARNHKFLAPDHKSIHACCAKSSIDRDCVLVLGNLFDCARWTPVFCGAQLRRGTLAMFETVWSVPQFSWPMRLKEFAHGFDLAIFNAIAPLRGSGVDAAREALRSRSPHAVRLIQSDTANKE